MLRAGVLNQELYWIGKYNYWIPSIIAGDMKQFYLCILLYLEFLLHFFLIKGLILTNPSNLEKVSPSSVQFYDSF